MTDTQFLKRDCPGCGSSTHILEMASGIRAEDMTLDALRPYWSGFFPERRFFSYHRCGQCGLLFAPVFFTDDQLQGLYSDLPPNMEEEVGGDAITETQRGYFDDAVKQGAPLIGDYLEIGPDVGHVTRIAAERGTFDRFWLFEPNAAVHGALGESTLGKPHTISTAMTDLSAVPDGSVGMAVMIHVLDHMLDPVTMLEQIRHKLRPSGALVTVTHNEKSALRHIMRVSWPPFCMQHPEVYNPASITNLMQRAGYGHVSVRRSKNYFPINLLAKHAAWTAGIKVSRVPLPTIAIGLRLGNILTMARMAKDSTPQA